MLFRSVSQSRYSAYLKTLIPKAKKIESLIIIDDDPVLPDVNMDDISPIHSPKPLIDGEIDIFELIDNPNWVDITTSPKSNTLAQPMDTAGIKPIEVVDANKRDVPMEEVDNEDTSTFKTLPPPSMVLTTVNLEEVTKETYVNFVTLLNNILDIKPFDADFILNEHDKLWHETYKNLS